MDFSLLQNKARKELESAKVKAAHDDNLAKAARRTSQAAKLQLKEARKRAKSTKKSAKKAAYQAEKSQEALDQARTKLEKLEKRARKKKGKTLLAPKGQTSSPTRVSREKSASPPAPQISSSRSANVEVAKPSTKRRRRKTAPRRRAANLKHGPSGARASSTPSPADSFNSQAPPAASEPRATSEEHRTLVKS